MEKPIEIETSGSNDPPSVLTDETPIPLTPEQEMKEKRKERFRFVMTFLGLQIALFLGALDNTIVATSLTKIGSDFNKMEIVSWVATAYILTFDAFQPLFSKFSDIFGRKLILLVGISIFLFGSILCGAAKSMIMLIVFRAVAGIGAAGIFSMVFIVISDIVPLEKRGNYQGVINAVFALSSIFGPLIGGSFTDYVSWRWNFYINLPIGAIALLMVFFFLQIPAPKEKFSEKLKRVDYIGTFIVLAFATLFLLALNFGGQTFPWKSAAVIVPFILSAILIFLFILVESRYAKEPIIPLRLFRNRSVASILLTNTFMGMSFFSVIYFLPIYFQVVRHDSAMWSGIRLIPMQLVLAVVSTLSGITISKTGTYRPFMWTGTGLMTIFIGLNSLLDLKTPWSRVYGITVLGGIGLGMLFTSLIIGLQAAVDRADMAVVTGLGNFARVLGGALGIAISSAVLNTELAQALPKHLEGQDVIQVLASADYIYDGLREEFREVTLMVYRDALRLCWWVLIPMAALSFFATLFVQHKSLLAHRKKDEVLDAVTVQVEEESSKKVEC